MYDITLYGSIGYTILNNNQNDKKILIFADMHDKLKKCDNYTKMADWMKGKFNKSKILLEEVNRKNIYLKELWLKGEHTQELKKSLFK
jgi:hypothetical protein